MAIDFNKNPLKVGGTNYFAELLGENKNGIQQININELVPFGYQPFRPYSHVKLAELANDIEQNGILSPVLVRPKDGKYQILAGHNRVAAAKLITLETIPCMLYDVDDDTATEIMLSTNLNQRDELLPSEKANAYKMQLDTMKRQGERTDLTSRHTVGKLESADLTSRQSVGASKSADILGEMLSLSGRQIQRFVRLTYLIQDFLDMVDEKKMPLLSGVELSYLDEMYQDNLFYYCENNHIKTIGVNEAHQIRELGKFDNADLDVVFGREAKEKRPSCEKTISIKLPLRFLSPAVNNKTIDEPLMIIIAKTIDAYFADRNSDDGDK